MLTVICDWCGNKAEKLHISKKFKRHFCSRECYNKAKKKPDVPAICSVCKKDFIVPAAWYKTRLRRLTPDSPGLVCSRQCAQSRSREEQRNDPNAPFKPMMIRIRHNKNHNQKMKEHTLKISLKDLRLLWEKQKGICAYTGLKMLLPKRGTAKHSPFSASVDRIDSAKPYALDNIHFVCLSINFAKNSFSDSQMRDFISKIKELD